MENPKTQNFVVVIAFIAAAFLLISLYAAFNFARIDISLFSLNPYSLFFLIPVIINTALIFLIVRQGYHTPAARWFLLFLFAIIIWSLPQFAFFFIDTESSFLFWNNIVVFGWVPVAPILLMFSLAFVGKDRVLKNFFYNVAIFGPSLVFLFLYLTTNLIYLNDYTQAKLTPWGFLENQIGSLFPITVVWSVLLAVIALVLLTRFYRQVRYSLRKTQTLLVIGGVLIPIVGGTITDAVLPILGRTVFPSAVWLTTAMALIIAFAILKYGLFLVNPATVAQTIVQRMSEPLIVLNPYYVIEFVNKRAQELFGYSEEDMVGSPIKKLISNKNSYENFKHKVLDPLTLTTQFSVKAVESEVDTSFNTKVPVSVSSSVVRDGRGDPTGLILVLNDLRELTTLTEALEKSARDKDDLEKSQSALLNVLEDLNKEKEQIEREHAEDAALLESIGDGTIAVDKDGRVILMNRPAEEMLEVGANVIGKDFVEIVDIEDKKEQPVPSDKKIVPIVLSTGKKVSGTYYFLRKDLPKFPVAITASPVILEGNTIGAILVFRDITSEMEIDRAKTEFVSLASHELRTPLATISWYTEMLLEGDLGKITGKKREHLEEIYRENQRMIDLVNALLSVSRIEMGTFSIELQQADLKELAEVEFKQLEPQIKDRKIKIKKTYSKDLPLVKVDPKLMGVIFRNLLSNSIKYTPEGGTVSLSIEVKNRNIAITISDTGYGIPKKQQHLVFTKLFRGDNVMKLETVGTGLGLYIVKSILDHAGGKIRFESKENKGTTFYISIPLKGMTAKSGIKGKDILPT